MKLCDYCDQEINEPDGLHPNVTVNVFPVVDPARPDAVQPSLQRLDLHAECADAWVTGARKVKGTKPPKPKPATPTPTPPPPPEAAT